MIAVRAGLRWGAAGNAAAAAAAPAAPCLDGLRLALHHLGLASSSMRQLDLRSSPGVAPAAGEAAAQQLLAQAGGELAMPVFCRLVLSVDWQQGEAVRGLHTALKCYAADTLLRGMKAAAAEAASAGAAGAGQQAAGSGDASDSGAASSPAAGPAATAASRELEQAQKRSRQAASLVLMSQEVCQKLQQGLSGSSQGSDSSALSALMALLATAVNAADIPTLGKQPPCLEEPVLSALLQTATWMSKMELVGSSRLTALHLPCAGCHRVSLPGIIPVHGTHSSPGFCLVVCTVVTCTCSSDASCCRDTHVARRHGVVSWRQPTCACCSLALHLKTIVCACHVNIVVYPIHTVASCSLISRTCLVATHP